MGFIAGRAPPFAAAAAGAGSGSGTEAAASMLFRGDDDSEPFLPPRALSTSSLLLCRRSRCADGLLSSSGLPLSRRRGLLSLSGLALRRRGGLRRGGRPRAVDIALALLCISSWS